MMAADLISVLNIDKENSNGSFFVVKSTDCCESSFVTSCILGHQIRTKSPMILVTLHQTFEHYLDISARLGINMKQCLENKSLIILDYSETLLNQELNGKCVNSTFLSEISKNIIDNVEEFSKKYDSTYVYIDDLTHLLDISLDIKYVIKFLKEIIESISTNSAIFVNTHVAMRGDSSDLLASILRSMSTSFIELCPLPTGRSKEVSGHMQVTQYKNCVKDNLLNINPQNYHFKLFDRGVKVFTPGAL